MKKRPYEIINNLTGEIYELETAQDFYDILEGIKAEFITAKRLEGLEAEPTKIYTFKPFKIRIDEDLNEDASTRARATIDGPDAWAWADKEGSF